MGCGHLFTTSMKNEIYLIIFYTLYLISEVEVCIVSGFS